MITIATILSFWVTLSTVECQQVDDGVKNLAKVPFGCNSIDSVNLKTDYFDCSCICDLTVSSCDPNCCCDNDCSVEQIKRFKLNSACSETGATDDFGTKCFDEKNIEAVNNPDDMSVKSSAREQANDILCLEIDNSDYKGQYFESLSQSLSSSQMNDLADSNGPSYGKISTTTSILYDDVYDIGNVIPFGHIIMNSTDSEADDTISAIARSMSGGLLKIPSSDFSGHCNNANVVQFMSSLPSSSRVTARSGIDGPASTSASSSYLTSTSCANQLKISEYSSMNELLSSLEALCLSSQSQVPDLLIQNTIAIIGTSPSPAMNYFGMGSSGIKSTAATIAINFQIPSEAPETMADFVAVRLNSITHKDLSGVVFEETDVTSSCLDSISLASDDWPILNSSCYATFTKISNNTYSCSNSVLDVSLNLYYDEGTDGGFVIVDAESSIVLTDLMFTVTDDLEVTMTSISDTETNHPSIIQTYSVNFMSLPVTNETLQLQRSGNPGYVFGSAVLSGSSYGSSQSVHASNQGWLLPTYHADGSCVGAFDPASTSDEILEALYSAESAKVGPVQFQSQSSQQSAFSNGIRLFRYSQSLPEAMLLSVGFGINTKSSCRVEVTMDEFNDYCEGELDWTSQQTNVQAGIPVFFAMNISHVGSYGNADPSNVDQWVQVSQVYDSYSGSSNVVNWNTRTCSSSLSPFTSMTIRFFTQRTGKKDNEQFRIVGSQVVYGYRQSSTSTNYHSIFIDNGNNKSFIAFDTIIDFIDIDALSSSSAVSYFAPPTSSSTAWLKLPKNSFYPFQSSSAQEPMIGVWLVLAMTIMLIHINN